MCVYKDSIMKPTELFEKEGRKRREWKYNGEGKLA
jgi:hypothetical protein